MKAFNSPRELAPLGTRPSFDLGRNNSPHVGLETARVGRGFNLQSENQELRNTFHTMANSPTLDAKVNFEVRSKSKRPSLQKDLLFPQTPKHSGFTTRHSSVQMNGLYLRGNGAKDKASIYEENRRKRVSKRFTTKTSPVATDYNSILFSRKVSEVHDSADTSAMTLNPAKVQKVRYNNKVMKQIFAKQILNKEHKDQVSQNERVMHMNRATYDSIDAYDLTGRSIHTDVSMSKFVRQDGSPIKNSQIAQTKGFAPSEFNKHTFGKNITLKYDRTKFRPDFAIAPTQDGSSVMQEQHMRSTIGSIAPSISMGMVSNKHLLHRTEDIHRPDSRPFLKDPKWPRDDIHANLTNFRDRAKDPDIKINKMQNKLIEAQIKADDTAIKLDIVQFYKQNCNLALSYNLAKTMDPLHLEMAHCMALMDKRFHLASLQIAACYRGIRTRRDLLQVLKSRKNAVLTIQSAVRRRLRQMVLRKEQETAAVLLQRYCRGHLVTKHLIRERGDISIKQSLRSFVGMKEEIGMLLANSIRYYWKVYQRKKANAKKKKKTSKKKGKKSNKKPLSSISTMVLPKGGSLLRRDSTVSTGATAKPSPAKSKATADMSQTMKPQASAEKKVIAQDNELSIDLTTGDQSFGYNGLSQSPVNERRATQFPSHNLEQMEQIKEEEEANEQLQTDPSKQNVNNVSGSLHQVSGALHQKSGILQQKSGILQHDSGSGTLLQINSQTSSPEKDNMFKVHQVTILDVDKEGSLNLDEDSDQGAPRIRVGLEGELGEGHQISKTSLSPTGNFINRQSPDSFATNLSRDLQSPTGPGQGSGLLSLQSAMDIQANEDGNEDGNEEEGDEEEN